MSSSLLSANYMVCLQANKTALWHEKPFVASETDFYALVESNHWQNFQLWHEEDKARRDDQGFKFVYQAKRHIDRFNQQRNNLIEQMDDWIVANIALTQNCPVHSETPGMMIDRLSILALKAYHMQEEVTRKEAPETHQQRCAQKLTMIHTQTKDLTNCLTDFLDALIAGERTFKLYRQFKMYNDPELNPQLYQQKIHESA